jgi:hypothetical protein
MSCVLLGRSRRQRRNVRSSGLRLGVGASQDLR